MRLVTHASQMKPLVKRAKTKGVERDRNSGHQPRRTRVETGGPHHLQSRVKKSDISSSKLNYPNIGFWIFWSHDPSHQVHISPSKLIYSSTGFLSHSLHRVIEFSIRPFLNFSHIYSSQRRLVMYWALICSSIGFIHQTHHNSPYLIKLTIKSFAPPESGSHGNGK